jgi:hypothetical protein
MWCVDVVQQNPAGGRHPHRFHQLAFINPNTSFVRTPQTRSHSWLRAIVSMSVSVSQCKALNVCAKVRQSAVKATYICTFIYLGQNKILIKNNNWIWICPIYAHNSSFSAATRMIMIMIMVVVGGSNYNYNGCCRRQ